MYCIRTGFHSYGVRVGYRSWLGAGIHRQKAARKDSSGPWMVMIISL